MALLVFLTRDQGLELEVGRVSHVAATASKASFCRWARGSHV